jgi:hypothetical protein
MDEFVVRVDPRDPGVRASVLPFLACLVVHCDDVQRLDVHNGLLLSALWDAAFEKGLVSFTDDGKLCVSSSLSEIAPGACCRQRSLR